MYVDDVLDSFETIEEACSLRRDLSEVLSDAGFKLRKWLSNETSVIADVPIEDRVSGVEISEGKDLQTQKTLGVTWNAERTRLPFKFSRPPILGQQVWTGTMFCQQNWIQNGKRGFLSSKNCPTSQFHAVYVTPFQQAFNYIRFQMHPKLRTLQLLWRSVADKNTS